MNNLPTVIAGTSEVTVNCAMMPDKTIEPINQVGIFIFDVSKQDNFQIGNFVGSNLPQENLIIINGEFSKLEDQPKNQGFNYNLGIFATE